MRGVKYHIFLDSMIICLILAYAFFVVFQLDHEVPRVISFGDSEMDVKDETVIKVMTYNIAHGRGHLSMYDKSFLGRNFNIKSEEEVIGRLDKIVELVNKENIDFLILEEVDFDTSWSYHVDQAVYIASKGGFNNVVKGLKWSLDIPYLKIRSGNAVLSKYPLMQAANKKYWSEGFFRKFIGGHSYIDATYNINGKPLRILATHFDSDSAKRRELEAEQLVEETENSCYPVLIAGDLNAVMPQTKEADEKMRDKFTDRTLETFIESGLYDINPELMRPTDESMFTYSAENPHRLIDFIFTTPEVQLTEYYVIRKELSDHFPLTARIIV